MTEKPRSTDDAVNARLFLLRDSWWLVFPFPIPAPLLMLSVFSLLPLRLLPSSITAKIAKPRKEKYILYGLRLPALDLGLATRS